MPDAHANRDSMATSSHSSATNPSTEELSESKKYYVNAWINYMRFARRAQGLTAARNAFGKARRDEFTTWEIFESAGARILFGLESCADAVPQL